MNSLLIKTEVCGWLPTQLKCKERVLLILIQVIPACLGQRDVVQVAKCTELQHAQKCLQQQAHYKLMIHHGTYEIFVLHPP